MNRRLALLLLTGAVACGGGVEQRAAEPPPDVDTAPSNDRFPDLPDSLALVAPGGVRVLFSGARIDTDSLGRECVERGLVLEAEGTRKIVPLLMTGAVPRLVNDTTLEARIWLDCRPGNTYHVDLRTGTPTRVR